MKNLWKKVTGITLGAVMALGVGVSVAVSADALQAKAAGTYSATIDKYNSTGFTTGISDGLLTFGTGNNCITLVSNSGSASFTVAYAKNSSSTTSIFNNSAGEVRLYGGSGNGGQLTFSITGDFVMNSIQINTSQNNGYSVDGGSSITGSAVETALSDATSTIVKNVASSTSQVRISNIVIGYSAKSSGGGGDVVTALSVSPTSKGYTLGDALSSATYTVTANLNGTPDTAYTNYHAEVGSKSGETFTNRSSVVFDSTTVTLADNCLRFYANDPTTDGGSTYAVADVALSVSYATLESIAVSPESVELVIGGEQQLSVTPTPSNADSSIYSWISSDVTVASVSSSGLITALKIGSATITATAAADHSITDVASVSVVDVTSYTLITDLSQLTEGLKVVIGGTKTSTSTSYAMSATQASNNRTSVVSTLSGSNLIPGSGYAEFTVGVTTKDEATVYTFHDAAGYLYAASSSSNYLRSEATVSDNSKWAVTLTEGVFSLVSQGSYTRNIMRFNSTNNPPLFACYSSGQDPVALYGLLGTSPAEEEAAAFATSFLSATETCSTSAAGAWDGQKTAFQALSSEAQAVLVSATYDAANYATNTDIQKCAQRYDLAVSRQSLENFMGRTVIAPVSTVEINPTRQTATSIIIIVVVGAVGLTAIGGYFLFSRKARKDND